MTQHRERANERLATNGEHARRLRQRAGLTQEQVAATSGISVRTISDIEQGRGASLTTLQNYAVALNPQLQWHELLSDEVREKLFGPTPLQAVSQIAPHPGTGLEIHPFSGRWDLLIIFHRWRGRDLVSGESVVVHGYMDLWIPVTGRSGHGVAVGALQLRLLHPKRSRLSPYSSTILVVDEIDQVRCSVTNIIFRSKTFSRYVDIQEGDPPKGQPGVDHKLKDGTFFSWSLFADESSPEVLHGQYAIIGDERDGATVTATRT